MLNQYDTKALNWIFTWVTAALVEKNDIDERIRLLEECIKIWRDERVRWFVGELPKED